MLSNIAVLCNAFVIAFTSDFIPKIYYRMTQGTLHGFFLLILESFFLNLFLKVM